MKILKNKNLTQKIILGIIIVLSFNFIAPSYTSAVTAWSIGGVLLGPVIDLVAGLGDAVLAIMQWCLTGEGTDVNFDKSNLYWTPFSWVTLLAPANTFDASTYDMEADSEAITVTIDENQLDRGILYNDTYGIPVIKYSPERIFANEIPALDANFINPKDPGNEKSIAGQLQGIISSWYTALRNLVIVGLLSILVYVGIRMMISSVASEKAKYKQMFMDWLVALCLVFFLHYIMSFIMTVIEIITENISSGTAINVQVGSITFKTNLTGLCRMSVQYADLGQRLVYLIFYIALVIYTFKFTWTYMKRAITMAFLTLMAPLVTLTYPIDKMGDGKAQAFNMWLKEYIFNAILQPFHLIIYTIFLGSSMQIAVQNPLYAILFLAFITPAEKMLRKFFKIDSPTSSGASSFAGGLGGAAAFNMMKNIVGNGTKALAQAKSGKSGGSSNTGKVREHKQITDPNAPNGKLDSFLVGAGKGTENNGENQSSNSGIDNERALEFRKLRNEGISQEEAMSKVNASLPVERSRIDTERALGLDEGLTQEQAKTRVDASLQANRTSPNATVRLHRDTTQGSSKPVREMTRSSKVSPNKWKGLKNVARSFAPGALKVAGGLAGAAALGTVGLGMGIAGDNLEDVFTYGLGGAALGYTATPALANNVVSGVDNMVNSVRSSYEIGAYGEEEAALREQEREFVNNNVYRNHEERQLMEENGGIKPTRAELNQRMRVAAEWNNAGVTDLKQIDKGIKLESELQKQLKDTTELSDQDVVRTAREQAITIAKLANNVDAKDLRDEKKVDQLRSSFIRELRSKDSDLSTNAAANQADRIVEMIKKQKKVY